MKVQEPSADHGDVSAVQDRLMKMLDAVNLDAAPTAPVRAVAAKSAAAPQAGVKNPSPPPPRASRESSAPAPAKSSDSTCTNCENVEPWGQSPWCPKCGFYPKLNRVMEGVVQDADEADKDPLDDLDIDKFFPPWAYGIAVGVFFLLMESIAVRMLFSDLESRGSFALFQIMVGTITFAIAHGRAYMIAAFASTKINPGNMITTPMVIWGEVFKLLPKHKKVLSSAVWGVTAMMFAVAIIGVDWNGLFKPDQVTKVRKINPFKWLMKNIVQIAAAQQGSQGAGLPGMAGAAGGGMTLPEGGDSLEGSLSAFADVAGADVLAQGINGGGSGGGGLGGAFGANTLGGGLMDGGSSGGLESSISNFADVSGAGEVAGGGAFNSSSLPNGGQMINGAGVAVPGGSVISSGVPIAGSATTSGPISGSTPSSGSTGSVGGPSVVAPVPLTSTATSAPGLTPKPITTTSQSPEQKTNPDSSNVVIQLTTTPGSSTGPGSGIKSGSPGAKPRDTSELMIFGFTTNAQGEIRSLLLAQQLEERRARFVGRVYLDAISPAQVKELENRLQGLRVSKPAVSCPYGGNWVRPNIVCTVSHDGWTVDGRVADGQLRSYRLAQAK